jgi:hypothetical protein
MKPTQIKTKQIQYNGENGYFLTNDEANRLFEIVRSAEKRTNEAEKAAHKAKNKQERASNAFRRVKSKGSQP